MQLRGLSLLSEGKVCHRICPRTESLDVGRIFTLLVVKGPEEITALSLFGTLCARTPGTIRADNVSGSSSNCIRPYTLWETFSTK